MTTRYFAPAGQGTSGSGLTRSNPIYGLSDLSSVQSGDELVFLPGIYYAAKNDRLVIPQNNLRLISEGAIFDGTASLNGPETVGPAHALTPTGNNWVLADAGTNTWKKGCISAPFLFLDDQLLLPMDTSALANSEETILAAIQPYEYTLRTGTTGTVAITLYLRLPSGLNPSQFNIRAAYRLNPDSLTTTGLIYAQQKTGLSFEGHWISRRCNHSNGNSLPIWIDRCTGVNDKQGLLEAQHFKIGGLSITGGDDISLHPKGSYSCGAMTAIGNPTNVASDSSYNGGNIEIYDWNSYRCGTLPDFGPGFVTWNSDYDGGVGVGYKYVNYNSVTIRDGKAEECGPPHDKHKAGWASLSSTRGSSVFVGTIDPLTIGTLRIINNKSIKQRKMAIMVDAATSMSIGKIDIIGNIVDQLSHQDYGTFNGGVQTTENGAINVRLNGNTQTAIPINICNNTVMNGTYSRSIVELYLYGTGQAAASTINISNNIAINNTLKAGFPNEFGFLNNRAALTGTLVTTANIYDKPGNFGRNVSTTYTDLSAFNTGFNGTNIQGALTINSETFEPTPGTANPIATGVKYWGNNPRPTSINNGPFPDTAVDIGAYQTTTHPFHPANLT